MLLLLLLRRPLLLATAASSEHIANDADDDDVHRGEHDDTDYAYKSQTTTLATARCYLNHDCCRATFQPCSAAV